VYLVHFLSVNNSRAFGGIHNQNSSTFTQKKRAAEKCPNSCNSTMTEKINIATIIPKNIMFGLFRNTWILFY
jgi:hypothetical protein